MAFAAAVSPALGIGEAAKTFRVSLSSEGEQANRGSSDALLSANGRFVIFVSSSSLFGAKRLDAVFLRDRRHGVTRLVSVAGDERTLNDVASAAAVSRTGRFIVFDTQATNIGPGDGNQHVYLRDRKLGTTRPVRPAEPSSGERGIDVSDAGRFVTIAVERGARTSIVLNDRRSRTYSLVAHAESVVTGGRMSAKAKEIVYARGARLFVWDRTTGVRRGVPLPVPADLVEAVDISADGRFVLFDVFQFDSVGNVFSEAYVRDRQAGVTTRVSAGPAAFSTIVFANSISDDGRYVAFESESGAFVPGDTNAQNDAFVRDMTAGETVRVSVTNAGRQLATFSAFGRGPALSGDGRIVAFSTPGAAVAADANRQFDVFVRAPLHSP